jgi:hypothetical protein
MKNVAAARKELGVLTYTLNPKPQTLNPEP